MNQGQPPHDTDTTKSGTWRRRVRLLRQSAAYLLGRTDQLPVEDAEATTQFEAEMAQIRQRRAKRKQSAADSR